MALVPYEKVYVDPASLAKLDRGTFQKYAKRAEIAFGGREPIEAHNFVNFSETYAIQKRAANHLADLINHGKRGRAPAKEDDIIILQEKIGAKKLKNKATLQALDPHYKERKRNMKYLNQLKERVKQGNYGDVRTESGRTPRALYAKLTGRRYAEQPLGFKIDSRWRQTRRPKYLYAKRKK